jgi:hypothetical protein
MFKYLMCALAGGLIASLCIAFREDLTEAIIEAYNHILKE